MGKKYKEKVDKWSLKNCIIPPDLFEMDGSFFFNKNQEHKTDIPVFSSLPTFYSHTLT